MKLKRHGAVLGMAVATAISLTACGSDNNAAGGSGGNGASSGTADVVCGGKQNLVAEGSSAQQTAITDAFTPAFEQRCSGQSLSYTGSGSGAGVKQFIGGQTDFSGSDSALDEAKGEPADAAKRCKGNPAWNLPMVFGPVAVAYHLNGVGDLTLTPDAIAQIFNGKIKKWNDPALKKINPGATLPDKNITVYYRQDESGTTDNFQKFLGAAAPTSWTQGDGKSFNGGVGEGKEKSDGVSSATAQIDGSITYVEWSYAQSKKLATAKLDTGSGPVELTADTSAKALTDPPVVGKGNDLKLDLKKLYASKTPGAYPLVLSTYEIVCSKGYPADVGKAVKAYLLTAATNGQQQLPGLGYVPLPSSFQQKLLTAIKAMS